jgi:high-affinity Fe2+/Pb2+ permease
LWLKVLIVVLFVGLLISLTTGLVFLLRDVGSSRRRTMYALGVRVTIASALLLSIGWGVWSGRLNSTAPWDRQLHPEQVAPSRL